jgi:hypothetical protein
VRTADRPDLFEILVTATNQEKRWFKAEKLCNKIVTADGVSGRVKKLLNAFCNFERNTDFVYSLEVANHVRHLNEY